MWRDLLSLRRRTRWGTLWDRQESGVVPCYEFLRCRMSGLECSERHVRPSSNLVLQGTTGCTDSRFNEVVCSIR